MKKKVKIKPINPVEVKPKTVPDDTEQVAPSPIGTPKPSDPPPKFP